MQTTPSPTTVRQQLQFDSEWRFHLGDAPGAENLSFDHSAWSSVHLPHDWSIEGHTHPDAPSRGDGGFFPTGIGWYRRSFIAPEGWQGRQIAIEFEGVYENSEVWINGHSLGTHPYGYTPFHYDLTPHLNIGAENTLAVRVDNSQQPNCRWYSGSGIYRHVWLHVTHPVHVAPWGVFVSTAEASKDHAFVQVQTTVRNDSDAPQSVTLELAVTDPGGEVVASTRTEGHIAARADLTATSDIVISQPQLWSPETPVLYHAVTRVLVDGQITDEVEIPFGIRTVRVSTERGFELNGQPLKLAGGNVHHDNGPLGAVAFDRAEERRVELLKAAGFNAIRTSHNPPSPTFLDVCDRLGMLVMDEAFDGWAQKKVQHDYSRFFHDWWQRDLDAMVLRDRNHPSIVMWSIGNEVYERGNEKGARIAQMLSGRIRELDSTRPIAIGLNGLGESGDWTQIDPVFATVDVAGYNYEIQRHAEDNVRLPSRVMVVTESYQSEPFLTWAAANDHPYVIGDFVWSALDYLGEAGIGRVFPSDEPVVPHWEGSHYPWHGAYCGDLDITGWRKPVSHYRNIIWDRGEKLYAAVLAPTPDGKPWNLSLWSTPPALPSWTWPGHEGKELQVEIYSRHEAVRLYLNDRLLGEKPTTRSEEFKATFAVPYAPGTLKAVGMQGGEEVETFVLTTAGDASQIRLTPDRTMIHAHGQDLSFVTVEIVDKDGQLRPDADHPVQYSLEGPGVIVGIGSGDVTSVESYGANPRRVFQGRAIVVIRYSREIGEVKLTASTRGFPDSTVRIQVVEPS